MNNSDEVIIIKFVLKVIFCPIYWPYQKIKKQKIEIKKLTEENKRLKLVIVNKNKWMIWNNANTFESEVMSND